MTMIVKQTNAKRLEWVQALRAFAALAVVFGHAQHEASKLVAAKDGFSTLWLAWSGAGVDLFFVISGFVMVIASQKLFSVNGGAQTFLARRLGRIVPLYWGATFLFLAVMAASPAALSSAAPTAVQIVKSLFFIPYSAGPELMQPVYKLGWTLNYEMFFYALFALFIALPLRRAVGGLLLLLLGLVGLGLMLRPSPGVVQFWTHPIILEFGLGVAIAWLRLEGYRLSGLTAAILAGLGLVLFVYAPIPMYGTPSDLARPLSWGLPAAALVAAVVLHADQGIVGVGGRIAVALGDASYSLYLLHPIVIRALRLIWDKTGLSATLSPWLFVAAVVFAAIALALVSYRWFERPLTDWLQRSRLPAEGGRSALARSSS